ncbi:hypothetical protein, partial [Endozoicomonas sp. SESOKO3]|uniref:hypothetical protein n=1 Tax=Endozoicomonas sp. SESOKO3 TaxID=2828744 RepID=UPI00214857B3
MAKRAGATTRSHGWDPQGLRAWEPAFCDALEKDWAVQVQLTYRHTRNELAAGLSRRVPLQAAT